MKQSRFGFLPVFFTVLTIAFGVALWLRLRSYTSSESGRSSSTAVTKTMPGAADSQNPQAPAPATIGESTDTTTSREVRRKAATTTDDWQIVPVATATSHSTSTQPAEKPSLLSRIVTPIVNAVTGGSAKPKPATASQPNMPPSQASASSRTGKPSDSTSTDPPDRTSDTTPPQLLAISFNPPQIHDGEETLLAIQASDDISGIRSISGTILAPSGAVQGFAVQREFETDRYIARITVPRDAADGIWRVNYLSLIDNATNATTMSGAQGALPPTASFRVISSGSDSNGPTLKAVWVDKPAIKAGEKDTVFVTAEDDKSGVNLVSGVLISPSKRARIGFVCRQGAGPWECDVATPQCIDCGDWQLEQIQMQDKANNMTTARADNPLVANVRVNVTGDRCDSTPPALQALTLDRANVSNVETTTITITAAATDDACGIMSMSGQASPVAGGTARLYFSFTPVDGQTWTARLLVPQFAQKGPWRISLVQVLDHGHNTKVYSAGDAPLANAGFTVQ